MPQQGGVPSNCEVGTPPTSVTPQSLTAKIWQLSALYHLKHFNQKERDSAEVVCV